MKYKSSSLQRRGPIQEEVSQVYYIKLAAVFKCSTNLSISFKQPLKIEWNLKIRKFDSSTFDWFFNFRTICRCVASVAPAQCHLPHLRSPTLCPETTSMLIQFGKNEKIQWVLVKFSNDVHWLRMPWNWIIGSVMDAGSTSLIVRGSWSRPIINSSKKLRSSASFRCDQLTVLTPHRTTSYNVSNT